MLKSKKYNYFVSYSHRLGSGNIYSVALEEKVTHKNIATSIELFTNVIKNTNNKVDIENVVILNFIYLG